MQGLSDCAFNFAIAHSASDSALAFALFIDLLEDPMASVPVSILCAKLVLLPPQPHPQTHTSLPKILRP
jgi:hypothetical protein